MNNLNIPPDRESWQTKVCRIATELVVPVLLPVSTALVVWLENRRSKEAEKCEREREREREISIKEEVENADCVPPLHVCEHEAQATYLKNRYDYEQKVSVEEEKELQGILLDLAQVKTQFRERQDIYCSSFKSKENRKDLEKMLLYFAYHRHYEKDLSFYIGLQKVLDDKMGDRYCGRNYYENGCYMWEWLEGMKAKAQLRKYERIYLRVQQWEQENKY